jgi:hypothetical protein
MTHGVAAETTEMMWQAVRHPHAEDQNERNSQPAERDGEPNMERRQVDLARLVSAIQAHEIAEIDAVAAYRELASTATDPVIASLLRMLLADEEHHHRVLRGIGMNLAGLVGGTPEQRMFPRAGTPAGSVEMLRQFARQERDGSQELRKLAREAPELFDGLFALLLNLIAIDGAKHELILRFVVQELEAASELKLEPGGQA